MLEQVHAVAPAFVKGVRDWRGEMEIRTTTQHLRPLCLILRNHTPLQFQSLIDIAASDRPGSRARFTIQYLFLSCQLNNRIRVSVNVDEVTPVPSLAAPFFLGLRIFGSAGWYEREVWDMFGVYFTEHGDLRRILTDYGFTGHPLRKDFPLTGFTEVFYNDEFRRITYEPVELAQEYRVFSLDSTWNTASKN